SLTIADVLGWIRHHPAWSAATALALAALLTAVLTFKIDRHLEGQVSSETIPVLPVPGAEVKFLNQTTTTDKDGKFSIAYQIRVYEWLSPARLERVQIGEIHYFPQFPVVEVQSPAKVSVWLQKREFTETGGKTNQPIIPPVTPTPQQEKKPEQPTFAWRIVLISLIPLLAFALWMLWRWIRRQMVLRKLETTGAPQLHKVKFKGEDTPMFVSSPFRRAAQELRRHRYVPHHELDVTATVNATIQKGVFTPAYARRRASPEYLLLIDRASVHDGQARLADELALRLDADKVYVDRFYFQEDARTLRLPEPLSPVFTLHELAARYPDHRLLVFSDAEGFFDPFTGEPGRWLEQFDYWEQRVLLTPESPASWGYREFTLAEDYGFELIPAKTGGLSALAELLNFELSPEHKDDGATPFPELIARDSNRWLDSRAPK
ncbi:MAG: carboxypeptidase-like regulatory domain-containing protein, partial [Blastocatellia bacterium]